MDYYFRFGVIWANFDKLLFGLALGLALAFVATPIISGLRRRKRPSAVGLTQ